MRGSSKYDSEYNTTWMSMKDIHIAKKFEGKWWAMSGIFTPTLYFTPNNFTLCPYSYTALLLGNLFTPWNRKCHLLSPRLTCRWLYHVKWFIRYAPLTCYIYKKEEEDKEDEEKVKDSEG